MNELSNTHASLLNFVVEVTKLFEPDPNNPQPDDREITSIDLDAVADEVNLPETDFIGVQNFSLVSVNDRNPLPLTSAMIVVATQNDTNNMLLNERLNVVWDLLQPNRLFPLFDVDTGEKVGDLKVMGTTRLMPIARANSFGLQGITFQAALLYATPVS